MKSERINWLRRGVFALSILITFGILVTSIVNKKYDLKVGDIAPVDFRASVDLVDEMTTRALTEDAVNSVQNQYRQEIEVRRGALKETNDFFNGIINSRNPLVERLEIAEMLESRGTYGISTEGYMALLAIDNSDLRYALNTVSNSINKIYETPLEEDDEIKIERSKSELTDVVDSFSFNDSAKDAIKQFVSTLVRPNYFFDEETTENLKEEARESVTPVIIKK
ncbi:MAG TPA: hypothetical protein VK861_04455, partial [Bacteroidales bacterium]|nr:hypothetical protein [Bacteroidales bacterium]